MSARSWFRFRLSASARCWLGFLLLLVGSATRAEDNPHGLMLASAFREGIDISQWLVSEKLDGVRGRWDGQALWSRSGRRIEPPAWFTRDWPPVAIDGELWLGRGRFEEVSALARRQGGDQDAWRKVRFLAFDLPEHGGEFEARARMLAQVVALADSPTLAAVAQQRFANRAEFEAHVAQVLAEDGEGVMLHHRAGRYRPGRSDTLLKYKAHEDAEARVIDHIAGKGKYRGQVGSLLVECPAGRRFRLGSGLSDAQRQNPPPVGAQVTYRYNGLTRTGLPRFARFLRVREPE